MRRLLTIGVLLLSGLPAFAQMPVASIHVEGLRHIPEARVIGLFPCQVGDAYTPACVSEAETYLKEWRAFDQIQITSRASSKGMHITVQLSEALLVGTVDLSGNYPLLEQRLQRRLTLRPGDTYSEDLAKLQVSRLRDIFARVGYDNTTAELTTEYDPEQNDMRVRYKIIKGTHIKVGKVTVIGNHYLSSGRFVSALHPYSSYTATRKREAVRKLLSVYRKKGFVRAKVKVTSEERQNGRMDITFTVAEGPHLTVAIVGNRRVSTLKLKRVLTFSQDASFDDVSIEDSITAMQKLYVSRGFPETQIQVEKTEPRPNDFLLTFRVNEGAQQVVDKIQFDGNHSFSDRKLRAQMLSRPISLFNQGALNPNFLKYDRQAIDYFYKSKGFVNAHVDTPVVEPLPAHPNEKVVDIQVVEGSRIVEQEIEVNGVGAELAKEIVGQFKNRKFYNPFTLEADKTLVLGHMKDHGHPYASVDQQVTLDDSRGRAFIRYTITPGIQVRIGEILLVGNTLTSQKAVRRAMSTKTGEVYNAHKILDSELGLRQLGVFHNVTIEQLGLAENQEVVHLLVRMEESRPFVLDLSAGASTDDYFTGALFFTNYNTFGWAKRLGLRLIGGQRLSRGEVTWTDPRFLGFDLQWNLNSLIQYERRPQFSYIQASTGTGFFRRFHRTSYLARYQVDKNYFVNGDKTFANQTGVRNNSLSKISFASTYDRRNSFADPTAGFYLMGGMDIVNEIRGDEANFVKFRSGFGKYNHFWRFILINDFRFDRIVTIGSNVNVPGNERFFVGGDTTIKGFDLDSIGPKDPFGNATGANTRWIHNIELRLQLAKSFQLAAWHDMGTVSDTFGAMNWTTIKQSAGPGIRIMTPVGPLKLDYGFVVHRQPGDPYGRFHFTFGNTF